MAVIFQSLEPSFALTGTAPTYRIQFLDDVSGDPVDPTSVESLEVLDSDGAVLRTYLPPTILNPSVGVYEVTDIVIEEAGVLQLRWKWIDGVSMQRALTAFEVVDDTFNSTEIQLKNHVLAMLGGGQMRVELPEGTMDFVLFQAKMWYATWHGQRAQTEIQLVPNQIKYDVADDCYYVVDVNTEGSVTRVADALGTFGIYGFAQLGMSSIPVEDLFGPGGANGFYSSLVQALQYSEMGRRVLSSQFTWEWLSSPIKKLFVYPTPNTARPAVIDYVTTEVDLTTFNPHEYHFIQQYMLAEAKEALGRIRGKFSDYAAANGARNLDADQLLAEATEMKMMLNDKIAMYAPPGRIIFS